MKQGIELPHFGEWLREKRLAKNLSLQKLVDKAIELYRSTYGEDIKFSPQYISGLELGDLKRGDGSYTVPDIKKVDALAIALDVPINEARKHAGHRLQLSDKDEIDETTQIIFTSAITKYKKLSSPIKNIAIKQINETLDNFISVDQQLVEMSSMLTSEDDSLSAVKFVDHSEIAGLNSEDTVRLLKEKKGLGKSKAGKNKN